ncbi:MAG: ATP-binding cassette domain-containing protein [Thaumarchaeota archaeon]|nr:ATP-binding cassette domain-containing protein [Nitrososphaerota archaeon]
MVRLRISLTEEEKRSLLRIEVNKSFKAGSRITKRTLEVSRTFGIGVDEEKVFPVFRDFELDIEPGDVVYVTGESGSGKSVLLKALVRELSRHREFGEVIASWELEVRPGEILVHGVGRDTSEAMKILSMVGLNEAYLFLRRYRELSEGQKYRYKLAKAFWSGKKTLIFDEFCSTLDRSSHTLLRSFAEETGEPSPRRRVTKTWPTT